MQVVEYYEVSDVYN